MSDGKFGEYGGRWISETLMPACLEVESAWKAAMLDPKFVEKLRWYHKHLGGRPTPIYHCLNLSQDYGFTLLLKREDLVHGGAHKFNNVMGQMLLAKRMGRHRIIAETGAGQHGVATAMAGAALGLEVVVYMGEKDVARQESNVFRMGLHGAKVVPVKSGNGTLKDAVNEAMRAWSADPDAYYCIGSVVGPHPFPTMVRDFQRVIGDEARAQMLEQFGKLPDAVYACVGGGSNAIGIFHPFEQDPVELIGVEAGGEGIETGKHAAVFAVGAKGILHGSLTYVYQESDGQVIEPHSISAGLDYPGVGPEHARLMDSKRASYVSATDSEAIQATMQLARQEGILPALESAHALGAALREEANRNRTILVCLSGRGDKDIHTIRAALGDPI